MRILFGLIIFLVSMNVAFAGDAERNALAKTVFEKTASNAMVDQMAGATWPTLEALLKQGNESVDQDTLATMKAVYVEMNRDLVDSMSSGVVGFYATNFTETELADLVAFYDSELGMKLIETQPRMMAEVFPGMMAEIQREIPIMMQRFKDMAEKEGLKVK